MLSDRSSSPDIADQPPAKRQMRYHVITADSDDDSNASLQMQRCSTWITSYGEEKKLHFEESMIQGFCETMWLAPLEVPGNRLPETSSRWTLLHTRGFPARNDQPRLVKEFTRSIRFYRREAVLMQLWTKDPESA
ncbi:hypothetical protein V6N11_080715 [Hibiscus sabdariffa]|uniref:Uncharacterized protein n=1 Tax=Hibiscus sabdariffa TaxID=183260 RepID=A0ABR2QHP7_9ROSI